jgi:parallel beta-helix repeat protein
MVAEQLSFSGGIEVMFSEGGFNLGLDFANSLESSLQNACSKLSAASKSDSFLPEIARIYGGSGDSSRLQALVDSWASGDFSQLPSVEILPSTSMNGANGAFSEASSTIYLSSDYLFQNLGKRDALGPTGLLIEEIGHFVDTIINPGSDTAGDEGALFSETVMGVPLSASQKHLIESEHDHGFVTIDNQAIAVEQSLTLPTITVAATDPGAAETKSGETANPGRFTLTRTGNPAAALTVDYILAGTATNGKDYTTLTGKVTFAAGHSTTSVNINPIDGGAAEINESVVLTLAAGTGYTLGTANSSAVTLVDNETPKITVAATDAGAAETKSGQSANPGRFTLTRTGNTAAALTVDYTLTGTTTNGKDYSNLTGKVTFAAGHAKTSVNVIPIDDTAAEGNESVTLTLAVGGGYTLGSAKSNTLKLVDNEPLPVSLTPTNAATVLYVATDGNNNNPGTISQPFQTISKAVSQIGDNQGGVIYVRGGTYANTAVWIGSVNDGSATSPLVIQNYGSEKVYLQGVSTKDVIGVGGQYVTIKGFDIGNGAKGIVGVKAQNLQILNNTVHNVVGHGIGIYGNTAFGTSNIAVSGNTVYNTALANQSRTAYSWASGITISRGRNATVTNNRVYQNYGEGIAITLSDNVLVGNNTAYDNFSVGGVYLDNATKTTVENNFVYSTGNSKYFRPLNIGQGQQYYPGYGIYMNNEHYSDVSNPNSDNIIRNNIVVGTLAGIAKTNQIKNTLITNNTIYGSIDRELLIFSDSRDANVSITNNIFSRSIGRSINWFSGVLTGYTFSNNLWSVQPTLAARGSGDIYADPQLSNPGGLSAEAYKVKTTSLAINAGLKSNNVIQDHFGDSRLHDGKYDIGADEVI